MKIILLILLLIPIVVNANEIMDEKIKKFCYEKKWNDYYNFWKENWNNWFRCTSILQSIYRFETWNLKSYTWNNIFNFKAPNCRKEWVEKYWCVIKNWFLTFPDKTKSIEFAVDRYYKYDVYKTINQIIAWWYYCSPVTWWCWEINWFTHTKEDHKNYVYFVKKYFNNLKLWKKW